MRLWNLELLWKNSRQIFILCLQLNPLLTVNWVNRKESKKGNSCFIHGLKEEQLGKVSDLRKLQKYFELLTICPKQECVGKIRSTKRKHYFQWQFRLRSPVRKRAWSKNKRPWNKNSGEKNWCESTIATFREDVPRGQCQVVFKDVIKCEIWRSEGPYSGLPQNLKNEFLWHFLEFRNTFECNSLTTEDIRPKRHSLKWCPRKICCSECRIHSRELLKAN